MEPVAPASAWVDNWGSSTNLNADYTLSSGSTALDAGDNSAVPADTVDVDGDGGADFW